MSQRRGPDRGEGWVGRAGPKTSQGNPGVPSGNPMSNGARYEPCWELGNIGTQREAAAPRGQYRGEPAGSELRGRSIPEPAPRGSRGSNGNLGNAYPGTQSAATPQDQHAGAPGAWEPLRKLRPRTGTVFLWGWRIEYRVRGEVEGAPLLRKSDQQKGKPITPNRTGI